jgi:diguanylate cyclase
MIQPDRRRQDSMAIAQAALAKISACGRSADPRSYALWYAYASGNSGLLSAAVDTRLARTGTLTERDIADLHSSYIAPADLPEKAARLGERIAGEIEQAAAVIGTAQGAAGGYADVLVRASRQLDVATDGDSARAVVASLLKAASEMAAINDQVQQQLHAMWEEVAQLRRELTVVRSECQTDPLTALGNRQFFTAALEKALAADAGTHESVTLLMVDVDGIGTINASYGHVVGDRVLRFVASTLKDGITGRDIAARYRDDCFAVLLPNTQLAPAVRTAEQFRHAIAKCELIKRSTGEAHTRLTVSIGVAALHKGMPAQALIETAELCLHAAKRSGRNCVVSEADEKLYAAVAGTSLSASAMSFVQR